MGLYGKKKKRGKRKKSLKSFTCGRKGQDGCSPRKEIDILAESRQLLLGQLDKVMSGNFVLSDGLDIFLVYVVFDHVVLKVFFDILSSLLLRSFIEVVARFKDVRNACSIGWRFWGWGLRGSGEISVLTLL